MEFNYLKINGFGKLKDKEINLKSGINVIYGENETGKSTVLKFLSSMLYGASKNKNGKEIPDFEKFKPWSSDEFSGKIKYTLSDGNSYEVFREFKKKNPVIYNESGEDISKKFSIDKSKGIDFFTEQTGVEEEMFLSTAISEQEEVKLSKSSQSGIIQKISNLVSTGDDNISFKKSLDKITKMQNEEVGTERTSQRPINIVDNKIKDILKEKEILEEYKENIYDNSLEKEQLYLEEKLEKVKKEFLREVKNKLDNNRLKSAEINFNRNLEEEYDTKIDELNKQIENESEDIEQNKTNLKIYYFGICIFIILAIVMFLAFSNKYLCLIPVIPIILIFIFMICKKGTSFNSKKSKENLENFQQKEKILNEIEILKKNREIQRNEANIKQEKFDKDCERENKELVNRYIKQLDIGFMEKSLNKTYDEILKEIDQRESNLSSIKFQISTMENESKTVSKKLEDLAQIEENLELAEEEREELISLNKSFNLAKECLEEAYREVKENISPRFIENLCDIVSKISNEKYNKIIFNDDEGLKVEIENGSYVPVSRLSVGTIDQIYISLRLSALNEITSEPLPIIFDETFAYFDNERLSNVLKYLKKNFFDNQILIFTCSDREKNALNKLKIEYNLINLEK